MGIISEIVSHDAALNLAKALKKGLMYKDTTYSSIYQFCKDEIYPLYMDLIADAYCEADKEITEGYKS